MLEVATMYAQADDDARDGEGAPDMAPSNRANYKRKAPNEDKAGPSNEVATAFEGKGGKRKWNNKDKGKEAPPNKNRMSYDEAKIVALPNPCVSRKSQPHFGGVSLHGRFQEGPRCRLEAEKG